MRSRGRPGSRLQSEVLQNGHAFMFASAALTIATAKLMQMRVQVGSFGQLQLAVVTVVLRLSADKVVVLAGLKLW